MTPDDSASDAVAHRSHTRMTRIPAHRVGADRLTGSSTAAIELRRCRSRRWVRRSARVGVLTVGVAVLLAGASSASAASTAPMLGATYDSSNNSQDIYYEAPDGTLREVAWTPTTGFLPAVTIPGTGSLTSAPAAIYDASNNSQDIYYEAPDGTLREVAWTPTTGFLPAVTIPGTGSLTVPETTSRPASTPSSATTPPPTATPGTTTLAAPAPPAHHPPGRRALRVKIVLHWRWRRSRTWLTGISFSRLPGRTLLEISCLGRGCPRHAVSAVAHQFSHRLKTDPGPVYRVHDRLLIRLSARNYAPERAEIWIRNGRIPLGRLLS